MATYIYNGMVIVKNSRRENYKFACINKNTGRKLSISSTAIGASKELERRIKAAENRLDYNRRALIALDFGKTEFTYKVGKKFYKANIDNHNKMWLSEEERNLDPRAYYSKKFDEEAEFLEKLKNTYIIVEVEKI